MTTLEQQIVNSVQLLWDRIAAFVPNLVVALIILLLGWLIGIGLGKIVRQILSAIQIDTLANKLGMDKLSAQTGRHLSLAGLGDWLVKWFVIIAAFVAAADVLQLHQVSAFLYQDVIPYFGNVIVAVAILLIGIVAANFLSEVVRGAVKASGLHTSNALAWLTRWSVIIFTLLAALAQLQVASAFMQTLFIGIIAMIALAGGLAFGLGGKEHASKVLDEVEKNLSHK